MIYQNKIIYIVHACVTKQINDVHRVLWLCHINGWRSYQRNCLGYANFELTNVVADSTFLNRIEPVVPPCDQCGLWLERYYLDVPMLQSRIHALEDQVAKLTSQNANLQPTNKRQWTTDSILFKNVESATKIVNSKLA